MVAIVLLSVNHVLPLLQILACIPLTTDYSPEINFQSLWRKALVSKVVTPLGPDA